MLRIALILCMLLAVPAAAQRDKRSAPYTVRGGIGIPKSVSSQMYRTSFNGVYSANASFNLRVSGDLFVGLGYDNTHFQNNKQVFVYYQYTLNGSPTGAALSYNTRLQTHSVFLKLGVDRFFDKGYVTYGLNVGNIMASYKNVINDSAAANLPFISTKFSAPYVQPEISVSFLTDRSLSFSILCSYTTLIYKYDPKAPRFNAVEQVRASTNKYLVSWISLGLGFNILIGDRG